VRPTAVVTGGSGGIGGAVAAELRGRGWQVVSLSRREGCDISDEAQVRGAFGRIEHLDALINCAAQLIKAPILELTAEEWDAQLDAGLRGPSRAAARPFV
jgi:2-C-methyl-D-erythritol 4-phosphate cytidylyltransferase